MTNAKPQEPQTAREMLAAVLNELSFSTSQCPQCGHAESCHNTDVYLMLERWQAAHKQPPEADKLDDDILHVRQSVKLFAVAMENKLRANEARGGWRDCAPSTMLAECVRNVAALGQAVRTGRGIASQAADVGNFAMMVADVCCALGWVELNTPLDESKKV